MSPKFSKNPRLVYVTRIERIPLRFKEGLPKPFVYTPFDPKKYRQLAPNTVTVIGWRQARGVDFRA